MLNRIKLLFLPLCLMSLAAAAQSKQYPVSAIAPALLTSANSVVRLHTFEVTVDDIDRAEIDLTYVVTILNEAGAAENTHYESTGKFERLIAFEGRLFNASGQLVRKSTKDDIVSWGSTGEKEFTDQRAQILKLSSGEYPYTVEFTVKKVMKGILRLPHYKIVDWDQSLESGRFLLNTPKNYPLRWKGLNTDVQPVKATKGGAIHWTWQFGPLQAAPKEPFLQPTFNGRSVILLAPENIAIDGRPGDFKNWETIGQFYYELNKDRDSLSPEMQHRVSQMIQGLGSNRAKIDTLYRFMQNSCRYVSIQLGIGGWQTEAATQVEKNQYGDCKALTNYMKALLKAAGITAFQALVYGDDDGAPPLFDEAPIPSFNHVILYVPEEKMWLECTSQTAPVGYLGSFTANRPALLLLPEGGKKVLTSTLSAAENLRSTQASIQLQPDGKSTVKSHITSTGESQEYYRALMATHKPEDIKKSFANQLAIPMGKLNALTIDVADDRPLAEVRFEGVMDGYFTRTGKRIFVPVNKINPFIQVLTADNDRQNDLCLLNAYSMEDSLEIYFPPGYQPESGPFDQTIDNAFGHYSMHVQIMADHAVVTRRLEIPAIQAPAKQYNEVRKVYQEMAKADGLQLVLVKME